MHNYIIDRVTQSGTPVYCPQDESIGDHTLDAVMLGLVAFTLTKTPLGAPVYSSAIAFSGNLGQGLLPDHIGPGELIFTNLKPKNKSYSKPDNNRTDGIVEENKIISQGRSLPANHMNTDRNDVKSWSWPGFGHDAPRPKVRSLSEAIRQARTKFGYSNRNLNRPRRKTNW